ncbi:MAG: type IV toxin-antitoxin system AbiEi family antitoxin domain-containing protein [Acidimicrobiales bacterium]
MQQQKDQALVGWLRGHEGVISTRQAERLGISSAALKRLVSSGRLVRVFEGSSSTEQRAGARGASSLQPSWSPAMASSYPTSPQPGCGISWTVPRRSPRSRSLGAGA